ncbi:MAG: tyrosine decarboxylase MfnA [Candidatus Altarchaeum sp. CG03_land_8_20_14_0_80_32_618]|nr:MAG: tyrosine decarboxylase MfnA [Candidatus Altarchaeum sp. CG03_land_8_20_14_0_80_32_618]PIZ32536.1 MAG: tyrosine decarboxylase MfnA [Candidatus Altarchaeum sp. CG_4_10_14_0_8_um_filter_32_851]PJC13460.1 MAG: tyrosine decarboxylase MfnA [Candidatus Altarchaeum sp. CG_4_9_14_0_8_um_filter_32_206]
MKINKMKIEADKIKRREILTELRNFHKKDILFSGGKVLSSMCTKPLKIAEEAQKIFKETNLGDKRISEGATEIEKICIRQVGKFLNLHNPYGFITSGGTESNILAIMEARAGRTEKNNGRMAENAKEEIIVPETCHFSFDKISFLMGIDVRKASADKNFCVDLDAVKGLINKNTIAVVGIAGNTEYGSVDDIEGLAQICRAEKIYLHVDAAFGGFVIPFLKKLKYNVRNFDFGIEGVDSIAIDPHKMGMNIIPSGMILFRKEPKFSVGVSYLGGKHERLLGTSPAGPAAGCYACLKFLGEDGYIKIVKECMENTKYLSEGLKNQGTQILNPVMNILNFNIRKEIYNRLVETGWIISKTSTGYARIVIMPHTKKAHIKKFLNDIKQLMENAKNKKRVVDLSD